MSLSGERGTLTVSRFVQQSLGQWIARQSMKGGDPVSNPFKTAKFLDVEVDRPARLLVVIADDRFCGDQIAQSRQSGSTIRPGAEPG